MNFGEIPWIADHTTLYRSDPEKAHMWDSSELGGPGVLPTLLLTTTGRKSGEKRDSPLIYGKHGDGFVIIASKGGMPTHPFWYLNLVDTPEVDLLIGSQAVTAKAREAEGEEREKIWKQMCEIYPPYVDYQKATERRIPVIVCDPA
jgi:deazaflavin-dependent oxidoreductase (nitroreductase family)